MKTSRFWRHNGHYVVFGGILLVSMAASAPGFMANSQKASQISEQLTNKSFDQTRMRRSEEIDAKNFEIANARMKRGCVLVVDAGSARNLVSFSEGMPVRDRTNSTNLPQGTVVCGANGETGVIRKNTEGVPVIQDIAVGDRELVYKNLQRVRGGKVFYNMPKTGGDK